MMMMPMDSYDDIIEPMHGGLDREDTLVTEVYRI